MYLHSVENAHFAQTRTDNSKLRWEIFWMWLQPAVATAIYVPQGEKTTLKSLEAMNKISTWKFYLLTEWLCFSARMHLTSLSTIRWNRIVWSSDPDANMFEQLQSTVYTSSKAEISLMVSKQTLQYHYGHSISKQNIWKKWWKIPCEL